MAFQGKEFSSDMKQVIVNLKLHFDEEKKAGKSVLTKNAAGRVANGLGIGEATVKRIMAAHRLVKNYVVEEKNKRQATIPTITKFATCHSRIYSAKKSQGAKNRC